MAQLEYFLASESISVDQATNRVSLFNVLEEISSLRFPALIPRMVTLSAWNAEEGDSERDFQQHTVFILPDGTRREFTQNFKITGRRHRVMLTFEGIPLPQAGVLRIEIALNGRHQASHTIDVLLATAAESTTRR